MENKIRKDIEQLKSIADRIRYNYTGWQSIFRKKKYENMQFTEKAYEVAKELYEHQEVMREEICKEMQEDMQLAIQDALKDALQKSQNIFEELKLYTMNNEKYKEQMEIQLGATARQLMKVKWQLIDREAEIIEKGEDILHCKICGYEARRDSYETKKTECRFNGGGLVRYICPECGVIFGPTKFSSLTQEEINDDYSTHYMGFNEGDSTQKELDAFFLLKPDKIGIYLNYGCGSWSKSLERLRKDGYQVYGYEPYAPETDNPYMITDINKIKKMRFDGIYSNDVIEHFVDPVKEFTFMKELLKNKQSKMAHSTSCYVYKHEVTRFHTHFYTGKSIDILCERSGFHIVERVNELDTKDFICCVFEPKEIQMDYTDKLLGLQKTEDMYILLEGGIMYGPYLTIGGKTLRWKLVIGSIAAASEKINCRVTEQAGKETILTKELKAGENIIELNLNEVVKDLEFVIENKSGYKVEIKGLELL